MRRSFLFLQENKPLNLIVLLLAIFINLIVVTNAVLHDPYIGYDSDGHLDYMATVTLHHLPTEAESGEYFSPPLPYFFPSLVFQACDRDINTCKFIAGKSAQVINLMLSIFITILLIKTAELISPGNPYLKISALILLGTLTVYYKTFTQVRGEPYLAFFEAISIYLAIKLSGDNTKTRLMDAIYLGVALGGLALSRQWGFLLFPSFLYLAINITRSNTTAGIRFGKLIFLAFFIAFAISSWFYFNLYYRYGSFTPFSTESKQFSFSNQPLSFYRNLGVSSFLLFRSPTRKTFDNQLIPLFYSDTWGDYWGYFTFIRGDPLFRNFENKAEIAPYLGRVNLASILPSLIFAGSILMGLTLTIKSTLRGLESTESYSTILLSLMVSISLIGYLWFLIKYPLPPKGATIKATYMIQIYIALPLLGAIFLEKIRNYKHILYKMIIGLTLIVIAHNIPAMITRYWWFLR